MMYIRIFTSIFLFFAIFIKAQSGNDNSKRGKNFYYSLNYQIDSTDILSKKEDYFVLSVKENKSFFASIQNLRHDSIATILKQEYLKGNKSFVSFKGVPISKFTFYIEKNLDENFHVKTYDTVGKYNFSYLEPDKLKWLLENDTKLIDGFVCQKATVTAFGRNFIAWFSKDIPINDGPFKFYGLPGLILEIYDTKMYYHFRMIKHAPQERVSLLEIPELKLSNIKEIDKQSFFKAKKEYFDNITGRMSAVAPDAFTEQQKQNARARQNSKNNPIELKP